MPVTTPLIFRIGSTVRADVEDEYSRCKASEMVTLLGSDTYTEAFIETLRTGMRGQILLSAEQRDLMARSMALGIGSQGGFAVPFQLDTAIMLKMRASERARYAA